MPGLEIGLVKSHTAAAQIAPGNHSWANNIHIKKKGENLIIFQTLA